MADQRPELPEGMKPALVWRKVGDKQVAPVRVLRGNSNGARSVIQPMPGEQLEEGMELVTGISHVTTGAEAGEAGSNNLFAMKRPERRQRGTGGAEPIEPAKKAAKHDGPPPPP